MTLKTRYLKAVGLALVPVALFGCANGVDLKPASSVGPQSENDSRVVDTVEGVHMAVAADRWDGDADVLSDVTPLHVRIQNDSGQPLRISYDQFALVAMNTGQRFAALPPIGIDGSIDQRETVVADPGFGASGFSVAPYYASSYPGLSTYGTAYGYDTSYYSRYSQRWADFEVKLPTEYMRRMAVPDGVIAPGGSVEGFLYFEAVPTAQISGVRFQATLVNAETGNRFGQISIPFVSTQ